MEFNVTFSDCDEDIVKIHLCNYRFISGCISFNVLK